MNIFIHYDIKLTDEDILYLLYYNQDRRSEDVPR